MTKISIYKASDFKKNGTLKKKATPEFQKIGESLSIPQVADEIKANGYGNYSTPYVFTYIRGTNKQGEAIKIFQNFQMSSGWVITSPQELLTYLV
jgi:hypothetical protein